MNHALDDLRGRYLDAQLANDCAAALALLDEALRAGVRAPDLETEVIAPAQREIGRLWEENVISVADEHAATAISQLALVHLYRHIARAPRNGLLVTLACVEGEQHDIGPRIAADMLDAEGFSVRMLGANVTPAALVAHVADCRPHLVALSVTLPLHLPALRETVAMLRAARGASLPLVVGGPAAHLAGLTASDLHVSTGSVHEFVGVVSRVLQGAT